jgi:hypothetical protein
MNTNDFDSDEYIDLSNNIIDNTEHIFQFHLNNEKLNIKYIGKSSHTPDIIIKENFGPKLNLSLYNCVYSCNELESKNNSIEKKNELNINLFYPIIKLISIENNIIIITSIAIKINQEIIYEDEIIKWELYWVKNIQSKDFIKVIKIDKNINSLNIIEKLIELSLLNEKYEI